MSEDRLTLAIGRLERALARVEAIGGALRREAADAASETESLRAELDRLAERHRRLRASAASAIEQLDGLVATAAPAEATHG